MPDGNRTIRTYRITPEGEAVLRAWAEETEPEPPVLKHHVACASSSATSSGPGGCSSRRPTTGRGSSSGCRSWSRSTPPSPPARPRSGTTPASWPTGAGATTAPSWRPSTTCACSSSVPTATGAATARRPVRQEPLEVGHHRCDVAALRDQPGVVVVGVPVALAGVADQRDHRPVPAVVEHLGDQPQRAAEVGAGGAADPAVQRARQHPHRGERRRVGHARSSRSIDRRHEARLHPRPADALDARARPAHGARRRSAKKSAKRCPRDRPRTAASGTGGSGRSGRSWPTCRRCRRPITIHAGTGWRSSASCVEDRLGDVVVAAPVGGPLGVGELVHVVAAALGGEPAADLVDAWWRRRRGGSGRRRARSARPSRARCARGITATNGRPSMRAK